VLAYLIAGHHAGLSDWTPHLEYRLKEADSRQELVDSLKADIPESILLPDAPAPDLKTIPGGAKGFALWLRMVFSCLVDADFLDTEGYMDPDKATGRGGWPELAELKERFDTYMAEKVRSAKSSTVNTLRAAILAQCRAKATNAPGLFTLTVPTGGGKTLSSLAFALDHAKAHGKSRIIYVIPYTSIIEQTADEFRRAFGELGHAVIEHHSNADVAENKETPSSRLACENWDAPIVVTTNVQFFESLFAAKTSRCRKLHNIVNSVVVIDEAQMLHPEFLQPTLDALDLLTKHYGVSVVLSTATQPALATVTEYTDPQKHIRGLDGARELMDDPDALYRELKRVAVHMPERMDTPTSWEDLADRLKTHESVLAIVNMRKHAHELHALMPEGTMHLSALMCGAHRSVVIGDIKQRIKDKVPTRVVSTQLVEAGVDLDFPVVYRAIAGLDSIAQAAGRCNREGTLERGEVHVFVPPQASPRGLLRKGEDACRSLLHGYAGDPLDRALFSKYFQHLYYSCDLDKQRICDLLKVDGTTLAVSFRSAADKYRLIQDEDRVSVVVLYRGKDGTDVRVDDLLRTLKIKGPERWLMRKFQRYTVNVHRRDAMRLLGTGALTEMIPGLFVQTTDGLYHPALGLQTDEVRLTPEH
jgi:CRISPR-associated endonuclease/helicase Cas3